VLCFSLFVGQAFLYNAYFFTYGTVITTFPFVQVDSADVGYYIAAFAISNFLGALVLGPLFDTIGRIHMISGTYLLSGALLAVTAFGVPIKGSFAALALGASIYVLCSTGVGFLASTITNSQVAAIFATMIGTMIPCIQFSGMIDPVSSLEGAGAVIGRAYPASHFMTISRGVFNKALGFGELWSSYWPLALAVPVIVGLAIVLQRKQAA